MTNEKTNLTGQSTDTPKAMQFCDRLRELRENNHLTQNEMAKICDVRPATYANWEQARSVPPADKIPIMAERLDVSCDYLLGVSKNDARERFVNRLKPLKEKDRLALMQILDTMLGRD